MIYLSFSTYDTYKRCPLRVYYEKNYPLGVNYAEMEIGKFMHRYFYRLLMNRRMDISAEDAWMNIKKGKRMIHDFEPEADNIVSLYEEYRSLGNHIIMRKSEEEYIRRIAEEMENSEDIISKMRESPLGFEKHIKENYGEILFHGYVDILFENSIGEIKTGFENDRDREQLKFYSMILYLKNYRIMDGSIIYILKGEIKDYQFKLEDIENLMEDAIRVTNNMKNGYFEGKRGESCNYCPYRVVCEIQSALSHK